MKRLLVLSLALALPASALKMRVLQQGGKPINQVLLIYDCGFLEDDGPCLPHEESFYALEQTVRPCGPQECAVWARLLQGKAWPYRMFEDPASKQRFIRYAHPDDMQALRGHLRDGIAEAWLLSGGGHVDAGRGVGELLRSHGMTVRVPNVAHAALFNVRVTRAPYCVSSCTIAFMGGAFRYLDPGASYEVHAASSVANLHGGDAEKILKQIISGGVRAEANKRARNNRVDLKKHLEYFHDSLLQTVPEPEVHRIMRQRRTQLDEWVIHGGAIPYLETDALRDQMILELEGTAALQDILMRWERRAVAHLLGELRQMLPSLGKRADRAWAMIAAMFGTSSIQETNVMSRETLLSMGYLTQDVEKGPVQ